MSLCISSRSVVILCRWVCCSSIMFVLVVVVPLRVCVLVCLCAFVCWWICVGGFERLCCCVFVTVCYAFVRSCVYVLLCVLVCWCDVVLCVLRVSC